MMTLIMAAKETNINSAFLYSPKWPAPGTDAFFASHVCLLMRGSTVVPLTFDHCTS